MTVSQSEAWITASVEPPEVHVSVETATTGPLRGTLTLTGPTGEVGVPVTAEVVAATATPDQTPPDQQPPDSPVRETARPVEHATDDTGRAESPPPAESGGGKSSTPPMPLSGDTSGEETPATMAPSEAGSVVNEAPEAGAPVGSAPRPRQEWKLSGITALVSGALMLLSTVLPQNYGSSITEYLPFTVAYLLPYLGFVLLGLGTSALLPRWRIRGLGALIGASIIGTVMVVDVVNTLHDLGTDGLEVGFWVFFVAPFLLLAAGALALAGVRREADVSFVAFSRSDWASWLVVALAVAGALTIVPLALDTYSNYLGWGLQALWVAVLAVWVPGVAVLIRPVLLGRWALVGWCLAAVTPVLAGWLYWEDQDSTSHGMWFVLLTLIAMAGLTPWLHRERSQAATP